jgi:hypothetical protein
MNEFTIKDSGTREVYTSGMVRDTANGKTNFLKPLDGPMFERWAVHLTKGAVKYPDVAVGIANWTMAAGEPELQRAKESAMRHFIQYMRGDNDEDHAAAVFFNINLAEYIKEKLKAA